MSTNVATDEIQPVISSPLLSDSTESTTENKDQSKNKSWMFWGLVILLVIILIISLYKAYNVWQDAQQEGFTKNQESERTDTAVDFNLRNAIQELESIQKKTMSGLSESPDF